MSKRYWLIAAGAVMLGIVVIVIIVALPKPPIPAGIKQQLTATLMLPAASEAKVERPTVKYDGSLKVLSFTVRTTRGQDIVISEQPTPAQFVDVPAAYQKVLDGMNDYNDFDVSVGTVHLTHPTQLNGLETAVLNAKGTLIFAKPSANLSDDQWRRLFTSFTVVQ